MPEEKVKFSSLLGIRSLPALDGEHGPLKAVAFFGQSIKQDERRICAFS